MTDSASIVRLTIPSEFEMLDFVQLVSDRLCEACALDEDGVHWVGVAVRESVINAIKHGNHLDEAKHVTVEFALVPGDVPAELVVRVRDEGEGFDPGELADPLEPDNLLRSGGRGIFFMRSFMDEVDIQRASEGGMEVRMVKRLR
ncbi:MAG: ATP-binding protein [Luteitalea sp.]|nr:ATP-binding protein [Luteitalea sp.]